jgi:hypothetical protein
MCIAFWNGVLVVGGRRQAARRIKNLTMVRSAAVNPKSSVTHRVNLAIVRCGS